MPIDYKRAKALFLEAVHRIPVADWPAHLDRACAGDSQLRSHVDDLLSAHAADGSVATQAVQAVAARVASPAFPSEVVGTQIGPYKLSEQIGEGGMGVVYVAEQTEPVRRRVALKIVKPGMDSKQVIARFEAERQALAMMDHPNIAKILDAGTTGQSTKSEAGTAVVGGRTKRIQNSKSEIQNEEVKETGSSVSNIGPSNLEFVSDFGSGTAAQRWSASNLPAGRPYFVMELVRGLSITDYCDKARLAPQKRLELFLAVCQAVQHAHQKGIIHRDLKPSNVMVTLHDGTPVVKVIDFGVAKAIGAQLTDRTIYTAHAQLVGTPLYMSPEQAELSGLDVDTRSDVYSLGVLLYELLTGQTPFDKDTLGKAGFDEMRRIIREDEPPRPSHRVSTLNAKASSTVSSHRGLDDRQLSRVLRGELDWIVMKSLEKDRSRRYESPSALAADLQRYLSGDLVHACPPSPAYRFRKFAKKNKTALTTASLLAASLLVGTTLSLWQAIRATAAEAQATANESKAKTEEQKATALAQAEATQRRQAEKNFATALDAVDRMLGHLRSEELQNIPQIGPLRRRILQDAVDFYERIPPQSALSDDMRFRLAETWSRIDDSSGNIDADSRGALNKAIDLITQLVAEHPDEPKYLAAFARYEKQLFYRAVGRKDFPIAEKACRTSLDLTTRLLNQAPQEKAWLMLQAEALNDLAQALSGSGQRDEALVHANRALQSLDERQPEYALFRSNILHQLAKLRSAEPPEEVDDLRRQSLAEYRKYLASDAAKSDSLPRPFGLKLFGSPEGIQRVYGNRLKDTAAAFKDRHPDEAEKLFDESIEVWRRVCVPTHHRRHDFDDLVQVLIMQARHLRRLASAPPASQDASTAANRLAKAESLFQEAIKTERHAATHFASVPSRYGLIQLLQEESEFILGQVAKIQADTSGDESAGAAKLRADALLTEAIQLCRILAAEFPDNPDYKSRLAALLKLQAYDPVALAALAALEQRAASLQKAGSLVEAESAWRELHSATERQLGTEHWKTRQSLEKLGWTLHYQGKLREAEDILRQALAASENWAPDSWTTFYWKSLFGAVPLRDARDLVNTHPSQAQEKFAAAELLMIAGYEGMKARDKNFLPAARISQRSEALRRLIDLYDAWGKPDEAAKRRAELKALAEEQPTPTP